MTHIKQLDLFGEDAKGERDVATVVCRNLQRSNLLDSITFVEIYI